jgi:hypothetical protein
MSIERALTLSNILTTLTPNIPPDVLASISGGAVEIRTRLIYNPNNDTLTDTTFYVPTGSPLPTPLSTDITASTLLTYTMNISQIYTSCKPVPSLLIVGTVATSSTTLYGSFAGAPVAVSLGYTTDNPPLINNVVEVVAGGVVAYSASAQGTLQFPSTPVTPPGSSGNAPKIVLKPAPPTTGVFQVFQNPFYIDASGSTSPLNLPLTFAWSSNLPVSFVPSNTVPNPNIQFVSGLGDYTITVTVTDSAGNVSTQSFTVQFLGRS